MVPRVEGTPGSTLCSLANVSDLYFHDVMHVEFSLRKLQILAKTAQLTKKEFPFLLVILSLSFDPDFVPNRRVHLGEGWTFGCAVTAEVASG